ncbi:MAG: adenylate/guanylate cyclase domain-containing protein [Mycobacteriales bacterium]
MPGSGSEAPLQAAQRAQPYAPQLVREWLATEPETRHREVEGSVAYVDISGFTKLSERLAREGKAGAEQLTDTISGCFVRLLAVGYAHGGALIKFGGDALVLLFTGAGHPNHATRAAAGMRRTLHDLGPLECGGRRVTLRMSAGVHSGVFHLLLLGDSHRELLLTGPAVSEMVAMESLADAGEIVISAATAAALPARTVTAAKGTGFLLKRPPADDPLLRPLTGLPDFGGAPDCLSTAVRRHVLTGVDEPEHKRVAVAFVHFGRTDALFERQGVVEATHQLDRLVRCVQRAADRHEICFLYSDIDRDGGKILLASGVPFATGNDAERLLTALSEINAADVGDIDLRIGVHSGHVFTGSIGPSYRRTYTVMGDDVNLAARVMAQAAPGQILATQSVLAESGTRFHATRLEPFMVKGKSRPVHAFALGPVLDDEPERELARPPLLGRDRELAVLQQALETARRGSGRLVDLVGDAGIGKTHLLEHFLAVAVTGETGIGTGRATTGPRGPVLTVACRAHKSATPYGSFRGLLRSLLGCRADAPEDGVVGRLYEVVEAHAPELLPWAPLLAGPLGVTLSPTPEVAQLDEEFLRGALEDVTCRLFRVICQPETVLVFDNAQWMDELSAHLLRRLVADLDGVPCLVCVSRRAVATGFRAPADSHVEQLDVEPLSPAVLDQLAEALVDVPAGGAPLAPHELAVLVERSGGNPLFLAELVTAGRLAGSIEALPTSVEGVIAARLDRLPPSDRAIVRRLSVLGQTFSWELAVAVLGSAGPTRNDPVWMRLADILVVDVTGLKFRHSLVRDCAYESLSYQLRSQLHALAGETIERIAAGNSADVAGLLSLHFYYAGRYGQAWTYSRLAAEHASAMHANVQAAALYERGICAVSRLRPAHDPELASTYEALADVRTRIGEFTKAADGYRMARRLVGGDSLRQARLLLKQGEVCQHLGRFAQARAWLRRADRAVGGVDGSEPASLRAQVAVALASIAMNEGRPTLILKWGTRAVAQAERANDRRTLARAYALLEVSFIALGQWEQAVYSDRTLLLYQELDDLWGQGVVLNNLGTKEYWHGRWNEAVALYDRARQAWEQIGDLVNAAIATANVGEILSDQGRFEDAERLFRQSLRTWRARS